MARLRNIPGSVEIIEASDFVAHHAEEQKGHWKEIFSNDHQLYIEIGMGKGRFLMDMAEKYPDRNFVGIELYDSVLFRAVQKAEIRSALQRGVPEAQAVSKPAGVKEGREKIWKDCNFRFLKTDAAKLTEIFAVGEIDGIYLNFSDPWPKDRHAGRRLTSRNFLKLYEQIMTEDAVVEFKTDNRDLFEFSLEEIADYGWKIEAHTFDLHHEPEMNRGNVMTEYEEKFSAKGNPICKLIAHPNRPQRQ